MVSVTEPSDECLRTNRVIGLKETGACADVHRVFTLPTRTRADACAHPSGADCRRSASGRAPGPGTASTVGAGADAGFTLVELIVAIILLAIALSLAFSGLVGALSGGGTARNASVSDAAVYRTVAAFEDDVARAFAPDRDASKLRDPVDLQRALVEGTPAVSNDPSEIGRVLDIDDVMLATRTRLQLRVDADTRRPGIECIEWNAAAVGSEFVVTRTVLASPTCAGATLVEEVFLRAASIDGLDVNPFSYELMCRQGLCAGSQAPPVAPCRPWTVEADVGPRERRWIVGVGASFTQVSGDGRQVSRTRANSMAGIRSRETAAYRRGLGC
jgi:prepilin-type N-terminal cleavage/methylation domain-containing protein